MSAVQGHAQHRTSSFSLARAFDDSPEESIYRNKYREIIFTANGGPRKRENRLKGDFAEGRKVSGDTSRALGFAENSLRDSLVRTRGRSVRLGIPGVRLREKAIYRAHGAAWTLEWMIDGRPMSIGATEKTGSPRVETPVERSRERPSKPESTYTHTHTHSLSLSFVLFFPLLPAVEPDRCTRGPEEISPRLYTRFMTRFICTM